MYHIFIVVTLMISQDALKHKSIDYALEKRGFLTSKTDVANNEETKNEPLLAETPIPEDDELADQNTGVDGAAFSDEDLIEKLVEEERKKKEELDKLVAQDIESLGLDIFEEESDFGSIKKEEVTEVKTKQDSEFSTINNNNEEEVVAENKKDTSLPESTNNNIAETPQNVIKQEENKVTEKTKDETDTINNKSDANINLLPEIKTSIKSNDNIEKKAYSTTAKEEKGIIDSISQSVSEVTKKISDTIGISEDIESQDDDTKYDAELAEEEETEEELTAENEEVSIEEELSNNGNDENNKRKEEERLKNEKFESERILKAAKMKKTLVKLRKEYIDTFANNLKFNNIDNDVIIPRKKILPKFVNYTLPKPLVSREKAPENSHHPDLMTIKENNKFMFQAIAQDRIDDFRALFEVANAPNLRNYYGDTLLIFAILLQKHDAASFLLSNGANPNLKSKLGYTPLNIAIEMSDYISVELLLNMGADINYSDYFGVNYLMQAVKVGYFPIIDLIISKGVDVNIVDKAGYTALDIAYRDKKEIIVQYLRRSGAKTWIKKDYEKEKSLIEQLETRWN